MYQLLNYNSMYSNHAAVNPYQSNYGNYRPTVNIPPVSYQSQFQLPKFPVNYLTNNTYSSNNYTVPRFTVIDQNHYQHNNVNIQDIFKVRNNFFETTSFNALQPKVFNSPTNYHYNQGYIPPVPQVNFGHSYNPYAGIQNPYAAAGNGFFPWG